MNPLNDYPEVRRYLYLLQWIVNLVMGATAVVLVALGQNPLWYVITTGVLNFVWTYTGLTAETNTSVEPAYEDGDATDEFTG